MSRREQCVSARPFLTLIAAFAVILPASEHILFNTEFDAHGKLTFSALILVELGLLQLIALNVQRYIRRHRATERMMRESEQFARLTVDALPTHIAILDERGMVIAVNRAWREFGVAGGPDNDRIPEGMNYLAYYDERRGATRDSDAASFASGIRDVTDGKRGEFMTERTVQVGELTRHYLVRVTRFPGAGTSRVVVAHDNIDQQKQADEAVNRIRQEAELANMAKSAFLANTSHEIRTPMNAILGYAEMLMNRALPEEDRMNCVSTIRRNGEHLLAILNDILDISKIEAQKLAVEKIDCNLPQLLGDVVTLTRPGAKKKGLRFEIEFDSILPCRIQTDPLRTKQVLLNLIGNAIKFTESGEIRIRVLREISYFSHAIRFEITDTGIGMTDDQMARLFEPFTQADASMTRRFGGTGLGLTISRKLARLLGGDIDCKSAVGSGTTFIFRVDGGPRLGVPLLENLRVDQLPTGADETASALGPDLYLVGRVLLAEDGEDNRDLVSTYLNDAGLEVSLASNGRLAVEAATAGPFDLVLMDMQMPEMDGYAAARAMRAAGLRMPIIALTANAMTEDRARCLQAGCTEYLSKPISRSQLLTSLRRFLPSGQPPTQKSDSETSATAPAETPAPETTAASALVSTMQEEPAVQKLLARFIARLPDRVALLQSLTRQQDIESLQTAVHQLRGAAGGYGFPMLTERAGVVEKKIRAGEALDAIQNDIAALVELVRRVEGYDRQRESDAADATPPSTQAA